MCFMYQRLFVGQLGLYQCDCLCSRVLEIKSLSRARQKYNEKLHRNLIDAFMVSWFYPNTLATECERFSLLS